MLKKFFKSDTSIFPRLPDSKDKPVNQDMVASAFTKGNAQAVSNLLSGISLTKLAQELAAHGEFVEQLVQIIAKQVLSQLVAQYDFTPTDKYKDEILHKQKYINQLDAYLQERKDINRTVENDLQQFLNDTTTNISKALAEFSSGIRSRITDAENRYGVDKIKQTLLGNHTEGKCSQ